MKKITLLLLLILSWCGYSQGLPNESFEAETFPPPGWAVFQNSSGSLTWTHNPSNRPAHTGVKAAFMERQNALPANGNPVDYLATPSVQVPVNPQLRFWSRLTIGNDQGTIYRIMVKPVSAGAQNEIAGYVEVQNWTEQQINPVQEEYIQKVVNIPASYVGQNIYIAFVMTSALNNGDRWLIDDVDVVTECFAPTNPAVSNIGLTTATLTWDNPSGATTWDIEIKPQAAAFNGADLITHTGAPSYVATLPSSGSDYKFRVRARCSDSNISPWSGTAIFSTVSLGEGCGAPIVVTLPYSTTDDTANYADGNYEGSPGATGCGSTSQYLNGNDVVYAYTAATTGVISIDMTNTGTYAGLFVYNSCANIGVSCIAGGVGGFAATPVSIPTLSVTAGTTYYIVISTWASPQTTPYTLTIQQVNCPPPTNLTATNINATSATLGWNANGSSAWEVVVQTAGAGIPAGAGTTIATNSNNVVTQTTAGVAFTPATAYEYYVRADCPGNDLFSAWAGPFAFTTTQIPATLPYTQNFETAPTGFTLSNGNQPNKWVVGSAVNNGGTNSLYISNDNGINNAYNTSSTSTVHAFRDIQMPATVDQVSVSFDWRAIGDGTTFVYDYMRVWVVPASFVPTPGTQITAGAGRIQVGGNFNQNGEWVTFNGVLNAATYANQVTRVVFEWRNDSFGGVQPPAAVDNINIAVITCSSPSALTLGTVGETTANITWTAPASGAASYDYYVSTTNTAPTATTTPTGNVTGTTLNLTSLTHSTSYCVWIRSNCGTANGVSFWIGSLCFNTTQIPAALPYTQDFEGASSGFTLNNGTQENKWVVGTAVSNSPTHSLYVSNDDGVTNSYNTGANSVVHAYRDLQMPATLDQINVAFDWKSQGENNWDYLRVWMVPAAFTPTPGTQITAAAGIVQIGGNYQMNNTFTTVNAVVNAAAYAGQVRRLIFEWRNDGGGGTPPPAAVDNVNVSVITCSAPSALTLGTVGETTANISWTAPASGAASYDYYLSTSPTAPVAGTAPTNNVTAAAAPLANLTNSTTYYFWVRSNCGEANGTSFWVGPLSFNTTQVAAALPYAQDFEGVSSGFTLNNGTQTNKWFVGTAVSNSPTHSLYISNDNGVTNSYNTSSGSVVQAYRDLAIPTGTTDVNLAYDWKNFGENGWDYIRVWLVPATFTPTPGTQITAGANRLQLGGNLSGNANWTTVNNIFNASGYAGGTMRLVFEWRNDTSGGTPPPAAIDNVAVTIITCPQPITLGTNNVTSSQANLTWDEQGTAPAWEVYVASAGSPAPTAATAGQAALAETFTATATTAGIAFTGLTNYIFYVRAVCSDSDKSLWSGPFTFQTAISNNECAGAVTVPVNPAEACTANTPVAFTGATASTDANTCNGPNGGDVWYQFTATNDAHGIKLSNFTGTANPIGLALYEGDECGDLIQLYCSYNNVINASSLVVGTVYKIRIYINQANPTLNTAFNLCVNTPPPPANNNQNSCVINTINPSFEDPAPVTFMYPPIINHNVVPGWRTTAADQMMEFWPFPNYMNIPAYDGVQFIELNANLVSGIYQDFATPEITEFTYSFAHRGRLGDDTIQLLAGPPGGPYLPVDEPVTTGNTAWSLNEGEYTSPAGQTVTRFIFQSVASATPDASIGNFLDAITFTANNGIISANPATVNCTNNVANVIAAGSGTWIAHSDNPAPTVIADATDNTTTISGFGPSGIYRYDWNTNTCVSTLEINYDGGSVAAPAVTTPVEYCVNQTAAQLTATALGSNVLNWYTQQTGGTASAIAPTPSTATATPAEGITYYVSQTSANGCESQRAAITVMVYETPPAPAVTDINYCQGATASPLTATPATGGSLNWYANATGGNALTIAPVPSTQTAGTTSYYVSQTLTGGCEGPRAEIVVTVNPTVVPVTAFTLPSSVCLATGASNPVPQTGITFTSGGEYTISPAATIDATTGEIDLTSVTAGIPYTVTYTILADPQTCNVGGSNPEVITFEQLAPVNAQISYNTPVCLGSGNQLPSPGFTAGGIFSANGIGINAQTGEIDMSTATVGSYTIRYDIPENAANCTQANFGLFTFTVTNAIAIVPQFDYDSTYCYDSESELPNTASGFSTGGMYTASPEGLSIDPANGLINFKASRPGTYTVTYNVQANAATCNPGGSFADTISINGSTDFTLEGACDSNVYSVTATPVENSYNPEIVTYKWTTVNGQQIGNDSAVLNVTDYTNSTPGEDVFPMEFVLSVTSNGCVTSKNITVMDIGCMIQKGISPNNDNKNDSFELTSLNVKQLSIFNRYGAEVYSLRNYTNQWHGQTSNGNELPTGTYYYVIERNTGETNTGWIYVNREE